MSIRFYQADEPYGEFSNFAVYPISLDGKLWITTEHYYQAQKFIITEAIYAEKIRLAHTPEEAFVLGRDKNHQLRRDWNTIKDDVMRLAVATKFLIHREIADILLATGDEELIEATTKDYYWGEGTERNGKNMLGKILQEVRIAIQNNSLGQYREKYLL